MIKPIGIGVIPNISDYLLTDGQAVVVDRRTERYLHDDVMSWIEWSHLGKHCNNATHDIIHTT
jgi:hypothetical protein